MLYTNVRSLSSGTKREELQILIDSEKNDVVGITETWGNADIMASEMDIPGFKLYRKDRAAINNINVKTYQFKTHCKGDSHSSKTPNIILPGIMKKQR